MIKGTISIEVECLKELRVQHEAFVTKEHLIVNLYDVDRLLEVLIRMEAAGALIAEQKKIDDMIIIKF